MIAAFITIAISLQQAPAGRPVQSLTAPGKTQISVGPPPSPAEKVRLTAPQVTAVPETISPLEYQQHMAFQKSEDNLQDEIDRHDLRISTLETNREQHDRPDIDSLAQSRTTVRAWRDLLGVIGTCLVLLGGIFRKYWWPPIAKAIVGSASSSGPPRVTLD
jgi:hypothetical protein